MTDYLTIRNLIPMKHILFILLLACTFGLQAQAPQGVPFNGLVTDVAGTPLKGVKVYVLSERVFSRSDKKGRFGLTDVNPTDTLHLVYKKVLYDIPVDGRKSIRICLGDQLSPTAREDEELVNWGYGYVKKRESVQVSNGISGEELARTGRTNLLEALQGRVPGLSVTPSPRGLGDDPQVRMRGINSINLPTTPLYVVDGVQVSSLEFVNVMDVERVEVLKDASIYGVRGANGAIVVTTRLGK